MVRTSPEELLAHLPPGTTGWSQEFDVQITETGWPGCQEAHPLKCWADGTEAQGKKGGQANAIYTTTVLAQMANPKSIMGNKNVSVYFFEAFDESTKGPGDSREPAFGLFKDIKLNLNGEEVGILS